MTIALAYSVHADTKSQLQKYFNDAATKVKATNDPLQKRSILTGSLQTMSTALTTVQNSPFVSKDDGIGIGRMQASLQEKQDELAGRNGYVRVSDDQLNGFSDYTVQSMEQAEQMITVSVVTLLLVLILVVILV
jgi:hypothetical protein